MYVLVIILGQYYIMILTNIKGYEKNYNYILNIFISHKKIELLVA